MGSTKLGIMGNNVIFPYTPGSNMPAGTIISTCEDVTAWTQVAAAQTTGTGNDQSVAYVKDGWALCNGAILTKSSFPNLAAKIAIGWNTEVNPVTGESRTVTDTTNNFRLPDFRGTFLRGVADYGGADAYSTDNDVTLAVYKVDKIQGHSHTFAISNTDSFGAFYPVLGPNSDLLTIGVSAPSDDSTNGTPRIGKETNPKQVGVYYLVKLYDNLAAADVYIATASTTPGLLSYYKEDIWTPIVTLVGGSNNTVPVYTTNLGRYTRIGNRVFCEIQLSGDGGAEGAGTGTIAISLPFASSGSALNSWGLGYVYNGTTEFQPLPAISAGTSVVNVNYWDAGVLKGLTGAGQNNTSRGIQLSINYEA